jgi:hypothetical protein
VGRIQSTAETDDTLYRNYGKPGGSCYTGLRVNPASAVESAVDCSLVLNDCTMMIPEWIQGLRL